MNVRSPEAIARRVNKLYKNYGTFEVTSSETKTIKDMGETEGVDEEYYDNIIYCCVHLKNDSLPGTDITAIHSYSCGTGTFFSSWNEHYDSSFFTDYYGQQMDDYYKEKLNKYFSSYDFKLIRRSFKYYDLSNRKSVFSSFDDFMKRKATDEYYYVFVKCSQDDAFNENLTLLKSESSSFRNDENFTEFTIIADSDLDLESINTADEAAEYRNEAVTVIN